METPANISTRVEPSRAGTSGHEGPATFGRWTFVDVATASLVFFSVTHLSFDRVGTFTPSLAVLVCGLPVGLVLLARDAVAGHVPSRLGLAFLLLGLVSVAMTPTWQVSLLGVSQGHTSWVVFAGGLAAYAIGRRVSVDGGELVQYALLASVALGGGFAIVQLVVEPATGPFTLYFGRPRGLSATPVYLGQFAAAAAAIGCWRLTRRPELSNYLWIGVATFTAALSGTRVALVTAVAVTGLIAVRQRQDVSLVARLAGTVGVAVTAAWAVHALAGVGESAFERGPSSGVGDRLDVWWYGIQAWVDRPVFGWGPGRFAIGSQRYYDAEFALRFQGATWGDAHNVFVELLVSWGLVGLVALLGFYLSAVLSSGGPFCWAAVAASVTLLLQPASPESLVVVGAALGVASSTRASPLRLQAAQWGSWALVVAGLALGVLVLVGGSRQQLEAGVDGDTSLPGGLSIWYRTDWSLALRRAGGTPQASGDVQASRFWSERATALEPEHSRTHMALAAAAFLTGDFEIAKASAERALSLQPSEHRALLALRSVALAEGDVAGAAEISGRLCNMGSAEHCPPSEEPG